MHLCFIKVTAEGSVLTPKGVQRNGGKSERLVDIVLGGVKTNLFGVKSLEPEKHVDQFDRQGVSSSFSSYNLFNHLQIEEVEEESDYDIEDEVSNSVTREHTTIPEKISKKMDEKISKKMDKKMKANVTSTFVHKKGDKVVNVLLERCPGCHYDHFPLPKFCRWWKTRKNTKEAALKQSINIEFNKNQVSQLKKCIESLETRFNGALENNCQNPT